MNKIDTIILKTLLNDARTTLTFLAKQCQITVPSVHSRITKLKKHGIITGSITQINPKKFGFECCGSLLLTTSLDEENKVSKFLETKKVFFYRNPHISKINFVVFFALPNIEMLARFIEKIKVHSAIKEVTPIIWTNIVNMTHQENLVIPESKIIQRNRNDFPVSTTIEIGKKPYNKKSKENLSNKLSKNDYLIAQILSKNGQTSFSNIAKQLGISVNNVITRYKKIIREKIILNPSITVNLEKLGYKAILSLFIKSSNISNSSLLYEKFITIPNVIYATKTIGPYDLVIEVPISDFSEYYNFKEKMYKIKGIDKLESTIHSPFRKWPLNIFPLLITS
jgi:DNA-binding Lrp family transcriptional regulator